MIFKSIKYYPIAVIFLLYTCSLLWSCSKEENNSQVKTSETEAASTQSLQEKEGNKAAMEVEAEPLMDWAMVNTKGLSLRNEPSLDSNVLRSLDKGIVLEVLDRSENVMKVNESNNYWYQVKLDGNYDLKGWVYGAFIDEYPGPEKVEISHFNSPSIDHTQFPGSEMEIFGFEPEYELPQNGEESGYDGMNATIFVRADQIGNTPGNAWVKAIAPNGDTFMQYMDIKRFDIDIWSNEPLDPPYFGFRFFNLASFPDGDWQFIITMDSNTTYSIKKYLNSRMLSVSSIEEPDPFNYNGNASINKYETVYIHGNLKEIDSFYSLVIYHMSDEPLEGENPLGHPLIPVIATQIKTDSSGQFTSALVLGDDLPAGNYEIGIGNDEIDIYYFDLGFQYHK